MNTASTLLARAICWVAFWPLRHTDRTVCRWAEVTHRGRTS